MYVYDTEAGVIAALVAGMFAAVFTSLIGQIIFAKVQSVPIRLAIGALFAAPAGVAGFSAIKGLVADRRCVRRLDAGLRDHWRDRHRRHRLGADRKPRRSASARMMGSTQTPSRRTRSRMIADTSPPIRLQFTVSREVSRSSDTGVR